MSRALAVAASLVALAAWADGELLTGRFRAVTLNPGERRLFEAKNLERVTGSSGKCIEEGMAADSVDTMYLEATCDGVRILMAWLKGTTRIHILACAEAEDRPADAVKLRAKLQNELKGLKSVTACVRARQVVMLGWAMSPGEKEKVAAIARKGGESVVDKVELVGSDDQ